MSLLGSPQVNKLEQVSSIDHQMLVTGEIPGLMSGGGLYSEVKGIMDNGHMVTSPELNDRQTLV